MIEDFVRDHSHSISVSKCLLNLQTFFSQHGKSLKDFGLPEPQLAEPSLDYEFGLNTAEEDARIGQELYNMTNVDQKKAIDKIMSTIFDSHKNKLFFLDGPG